MTRYEMIKKELAGQGVGRIRRQPNLNEGIAITILLNEEEANSLNKLYWLALHFADPNCCGVQFSLSYLSERIGGKALSEVISQRIADKVAKAMSACEKYGYTPEHAIWFKLKKVIEVRI